MLQVIARVSRYLHHGSDLSLFLFFSSFPSSKFPIVLSLLFTSRPGNVYFISMLTPSLVLTMLSTHRSFTAFPRYRFLLILFAFCNPTNLDSVYNTPSHKLLSRYHHSRLFWHPGFEHRLIIIPFQVEWHIDAVVLTTHHRPSPLVTKSQQWTRRWNILTTEIEIAIIMLMFIAAITTLKTKSGNSLWTRQWQHQHVWYTLYPSAVFAERVAMKWHH